AVARERAVASRTPMSPDAFNTFIGQFGFSSEASSRHRRIIFNDGSPVTYYLESDNALVNATYNAHPHVLQVYQRTFLEGLDYLIRNGQAVGGPPNYHVLSHRRQP
ncbi:MAG: hypothetical protein K2Z81_15270, partial [Cyanobacteria bacterium]|nr:hypothetical protein [Cyanobacteriota bacterium]